MTIHATEARKTPLIDRLREEERLPPPAERRRLRDAVEVTQQDIADELNVSDAAVSCWERGICTPGPRHYAAYLHLLRGFAALERDRKRNRASPQAQK
jgi:DNA-binding transcriptional regulator YiaG